MTGFGTFARDGRVRTAATAAQAVQLTYAGWQPVPDEPEPIVTPPHKDEPDHDTDESPDGDESPAEPHADDEPPHRRRFHKHTEES